MIKDVLVTSRSFGTVGSEAANLLKGAGLNVVRIDAGEFEDCIEQYDALIIGAHEFRSNTMRRCNKLRIICKHGAEVNNIPIETARQMGISVTNVPNINANPVADLTFGLLLAISRQIVFTNKAIHEGNWRTAVGTEVCGKTLGLIGYGSIGKRVAKRAAGFDMNVLAYDPYIASNSDEPGCAKLCSMDEVLQKSDFLSLNLSLTEETEQLVSRDFLLKMKAGSYLINTANGKIVDEDALYAALASGHLAGAAVDVCFPEPMRSSNQLLSLDNFIITSHIGVYTKEAIAAVSLACAKNIVAKMRGEKIAEPG